jgi:hypothetical protein
MRILKKYFSLFLLLSGVSNTALGECSSVCSEDCVQAPKTMFVPMASPIGQNLVTQAHEPLDVKAVSHMGEECHWLNRLAFDGKVTARYARSFNPCQMADYVFGLPGEDGLSSQNFVIQGRDVPGRNPLALAAENFGFNRTADIPAISFSPLFQYGIVDFQFAVSGNDLWLQVNLPVVNAHASLTKGCKVPTADLSNDALDGLDLKVTYQGVQDPAKIGTITLASGDNSVVVGGANLAPDGTSWGVSFASNSANAKANNTVVNGLVSLEAENLDTDGAYLANGYGNEYQYGMIPAGLYAPLGGPLEPATLEASFAATAKDLSTFTVEDVLPATRVSQGLGGYTFGKVAQRAANNMRFSNCSKTGLADIILNFGWDFVKREEACGSVYGRFVVPTGTSINKQFIKYVFQPVIGNGHHYELGLGANGRVALWSGNDSGLSVHADGYATHMFGTCQTRTFDLERRPLSRYALVYDLGSNEDALSQDVMGQLGDYNLYNGKVWAERGEFICDLLWMVNSDLELTFGYAFSGQTAEQMSCSANKISGDSKYAFVGDVMSGAVAVARTVSGGGGEVSNDIYKSYVILDGGTGSIPGAYAIPNAGSAASFEYGENPAFGYGVSDDVQDIAFVLPDLESNRSGLMEGQILNRLYFSGNYVWRNCRFQPEIGGGFSYGFVPSNYVTPKYGDVWATFGFAF